MPTPPPDSKRSDDTSNRPTAGSVAIRNFTATDTHAVTQIYRQHVYGGPAASGWRRKKSQFDLLLASDFPFVVAVRCRRRRRAVDDGDGDDDDVVGDVIDDEDADEVVVGFAYASPVKARCGQFGRVEDSVYIDRLAQRRGIGRLLLSRLIAECRSRGFRRMIALIGDAANAASIGLHRALGFEQVRSAVSLRFDRSGEQHLDLVTMELPLFEGRGGAEGDDGDEGTPPLSIQPTKRLRGCDVDDNDDDDDCPLAMFQ